MDLPRWEDWIHDAVIWEARNLPMVHRMHKGISIEVRMSLFDIAGTICAGFSNQGADVQSLVERIADILWFSLVTTETAQKERALV